jgi:hypothetical protein
MRSLLGRDHSHEDYRKYVTCLLVQYSSPSGFRRLITGFAVLGRTVNRSSGDS